FQQQYWRPAAVTTRNLLPTVARPAEGAPAAVRSDAVPLMLPWAERSSRTAAPHLVRSQLTRAPAAEARMRARAVRSTGVRKRAAADRPRAAVERRPAEPSMPAAPPRDPVASAREESPPTQAPREVQCATPASPTRAPSHRG